MIMTVSLLLGENCFTFQEKCIELSSKKIHKTKEQQHPTNCIFIFIVYLFGADLHTVLMDFHTKYAKTKLSLLAKVVDLDPCLTKKPVEDSACHPYNTRGSMSEVQSLSSFQSESCDDNGKFSFRMLNLEKN